MNSNNKEEVKEVSLYLTHLPTCNTKQDWSEAIQAMGDTPQDLRDETWYYGYEEMRTKMDTCNCGLEEVKKSLLTASECGTIWDAAVTISNNLCIDISNRHNDDDEIVEARIANECAKEIRKGIGKYNEFKPYLSHAKKLFLKN